MQKSEQHSIFSTDSYQSNYMFTDCGAMCTGIISSAKHMHISNTFRKCAWNRHSICNNVATPLLNSSQVVFNKSRTWSGLLSGVIGVKMVPETCGSFLSVRHAFLQVQVFTGMRNFYQILECVSHLTTPAKAKSATENFFGYCSNFCHPTNKVISAIVISSEYQQHISIVKAIVLLAGA